MSRLPIETKEKAVLLRKKGYSFTEIANKLNIAKSTTSLWLRDIILDEKAKDRLVKRGVMGRYKATLRWQEKRIREEKHNNLLASKIIGKVKRNREHMKLYCSLLYWCEGGKSENSEVRFVNSDPELIRVFVSIFREAFSPIQEEKFRILMYLHGYHDENIQKDFWSNLTGISKDLFQKTYHKHHTKKRIKDGYPGCIAVRYYDVKIARQIKSIYKIFARHF